MASTSLGPQLRHAAEVLGKEVDQRPHSRREVTPFGRIDDEEPRGRQLERAEHLDQCAGWRARAGDETRHAGDAEPRDGGGDADFGIGEAQPSMHRDADRFALGRAEAPDAGIAEIGVDDAIVVGERGGPGGKAAPRKIGRRGAGDDAHRAQAARDQAPNPPARRCAPRRSKPSSTRLARRSENETSSWISG